MRNPIDAQVTPSGQLELSSPYLPAFAERAKALGGRWLADRKVWAFDARDADRVRALCQGLYGHDWTALPQTITVQLDLGRRQAEVEERRTYNDAELVLFGRIVLRRPTRDASVQLGPGVVILAGHLASSGGSARYPALGDVDGLVIEVKDVPASLLPAEQQRWGDYLRVVETPPAPVATVMPDRRPEHDPEITAILEAFGRLSATKQAQVLELLNNSLPEVQP